MFFFVKVVLAENVDVTQAFCDGLAGVTTNFDISVMFGIGFEDYNDTIYLHL